MSIADLEDHDMGRTYREDLRRLVDIVWQHATESTAVPSTKTADMLIERFIQQITRGNHEKI